MGRAIRMAVQGDCNVANALAGLPTLGRNALTNEVVSVPPNWRGLVASGTVVPGVSGYFLREELEEDGADADGVPILVRTGNSVVVLDEPDAVKVENGAPPPVRARLDSAPYPRRIKGRK